MKRYDRSVIILLSGMVLLGAGCQKEQPVSTGANVTAEASGTAEQTASPQETGESITMSQEAEDVYASIWEMYITIDENEEFEPGGYKLRATTMEQIRAEKGEAIPREGAREDDTGLYYEIPMELSDGNTITVGITYEQKDQEEPLLWQFGVFVPFATEEERDAICQSFFTWLEENYPLEQYPSSQIDQLRPEQLVEGGLRGIGSMSGKSQISAGVEVPGTMENREPDTFVVIVRVNMG